MSEALIPKRLVCIKKMLLQPFFETLKGLDAFQGFGETIPILNGRKCKRLRGQCLLFRNEVVIRTMSSIVHVTLGNRLKIDRQVIWRISCSYFENMRQFKKSDAIWDR